MEFLMLGIVRYFIEQVLMLCVPLMLLFACHLMFKHQTCMSSDELRLVYSVVFSLNTPPAPQTLKACRVLHDQIAKCRLVCKSWANAGLERLRLNIQVFRDRRSAERLANIFRRGDMNHYLSYDRASDEMVLTTLPHHRTWSSVGSE